jgi:hypothetical protein
MTPALLVERGFIALRHTRIVVARVAARAGRSGAIAFARVLAFPWSIGMAFAHTHPQSWQSEHFMAWQAYQDFCHESSLRPI